MRLIPKFPQTGAEAQASGSDEDGESDEDGDSEEDSFNLRLASESEDDDQMSGDASSDSDMASEENQLEDEGDEASDEDMDTFEDPGADEDDEPLEKMPFRGPLAVKPKTQRIQKPTSVLDGVDTDSNDEEQMETAEAGNADDSEESEDDAVPELDNQEKTLTKEWELYGIDNRILKALAALKYTEPTEIQSQCLTPAIRDRYGRVIPFESLPRD